jgi:hypothetical protein
MYSMKLVVTLPPAPLKNNNGRLHFCQNKRFGRGQKCVKNVENRRQSHKILKTVYVCNIGSNFFITKVYGSG